MQPSAGLLVTLALSFFTAVNAGPHMRGDVLPLRNGQDAIALKYAFLLFMA